MSSYHYAIILRNYVIFTLYLVSKFVFLEASIQLFQFDLAQSDKSECHLLLEWNLFRFHFAFPLAEFHVLNPPNRVISRNPPISKKSDHW